MPPADGPYRGVALCAGTLDAGQKSTARVRLPKKAIVHVTDNGVHEEPHGRPANVFQESMLRCHAERRMKSVLSSEIAASPVATDAHSDGCSMTATLADVFGAKENMVGCVGGRARAARGATRSKVWEDLTEVAVC